jgi:hypothetical protein
VGGLGFAGNTNEPKADVPNNPGEQIMFSTGSFLGLLHCEDVRKFSFTRAVRMANGKLRQGAVELWQKVDKKIHFQKRKPTRPSFGRCSEYFSTNNITHTAFDSSSRVLPSS